MTSNGKLVAQISEQWNRIESDGNADERVIQEWENEGGALVPLSEDNHPFKEKKSTANLSLVC